MNPAWSTLYLKESEIECLRADPVWCAHCPTPPNTNKGTTMPQLPVASISDSEEDQTRRTWSTMNKVLTRLEARGIKLPERTPSFPIPEVTTTLVDSDGQEYLKTNAKYLAWLNYLLPYLAFAKGVILEAQNEKNQIEVMHRTTMRELESDAGKTRSKNKMTKEELNDLILLDPRHIELRQIEQEMTQEKYMLEATLDDLERAMRVISRHVEVKKVDMEMNKSGMGLPQRHPYTFGRG